MRRCAALGALLTLAGLAACAGPPPQRNPCDGKLGISGRAQGTRIAVEARNDCHVPVTLLVSFQLENLRPSGPLPVEVALAPGERAHVVDLDVVRADRGYAYSANSEITVGGPARPDPAARYAFPFGGEVPRRLSQGVDGPLTHQGLHRYSFDFDLPIGTPVLAARDGVVFEVQDGYGEGGTRESDEQGNMVVVWHADGTFALYGHLRKGVCAREGESVRAGDFLGWSGNSGYTSGPHLHFGVAVASDAGAEMQTIPIQFEGDVVPEEGGLYGPGPTGGRAAPPTSPCGAADARDS